MKLKPLPPHIRPTHTVDTGAFTNSMVVEVPRNHFYLCFLE